MVIHQSDLRGVVNISTGCRDVIQACSYPLYYDRYPLNSLSMLWNINLSSVMAKSSPAAFLE
jgi:hypothetical protein